METKEVIFPDGIMFKNPHDKAPDFIKGSVYIHVKKFQNWIAQNPTLVSEMGWLPLDLKLSKKGTMYFQVNTYKPKEIMPKDEVSMPDFGETSAPKDEDGIEVPF